MSAEKNNYPEFLGDILKRVVKQDYKLTEAIFFNKLKDAWTKLAGEMANHTTVCDYKNRILWLETTNSAWAQQLVFFRQTIIEKYKTLYPSIEIKDIRIKSTGVQAGKIVFKQTDEGATAEEKLKAEETLADFDGPAEAREFLGKLLEKSRVIRKYEKRDSCRICGLKINPGETRCFKCKHLSVSQMEDKVHRYLQEAPWSRHQDIVKDFPEVGEDAYHVFKEHLIKRLEDKLKNYCYNKERINQKESKAIKLLSLRLVMLKSGLTPEKINDKIIKEVLGNRSYQAIFMAQKNNGGVRA